MSGTMTFNGTAASAYGLRIGGVNTYKGAGNTIETIRVPGRMGDVVYNNTEKNVGNEIREYNAALYMRASSVSNVEKRLAQIRDWLLNTRTGSAVRPGYKTLRDSYEPDFYRRAFFTGDVTPIRKGAGQNFEIPLTVSCDPRRYLANVSDVVMSYGASGPLQAEIGAPSDWFSLIVYPAKPLIKVEGYGANDAFNFIFTDSTYTEELGKIQFAENIPTLYFDTETLNATSEPYGGTNLNQFIVDVTGDVWLNGYMDYVKRNDKGTKITITPRWWVR